MIVFLLLFIGLPIAFTLVYGDEERTIAYWMPMTFLILLVIWTVISLPCVLLQTKFHVPLYVFIAVIILFAIFLVFMLIKRRRVIKEKVKDFFSGNLKKYFTNVFFIIMLVLVLFQAGRATIFQFDGYNDSKTYVSLANDIVESDSFYMISDANGILLEDVSGVSTKYRLSTWYSFESALSVIFNVHPLITINTILPGYLIIISYLIFWSMASIIFEHNISKMSFFVIVMAAFNEVISNDITSTLLVKPTWGKNITAMIMVPMFVYGWIGLNQLAVMNKKRIVVELFLVVTGGCAASNMGFMIMPIELTFLTITEMVVRRKVEKKIIIQYIILLVPVAFFCLAYFACS